MRALPSNTALPSRLATVTFAAVLILGLFTVASPATSADEVAQPRPDTVRDLATDQLIVSPAITETPPPPLPIRRPLPLPPSTTSTTLVPQTMTTVPESTTTSSTVVHPAGPWRLTVGSGNATPMDTNSPPGAGSSHGVRIYCAVSHYSHDDSVVFPGQPGAAHAHMFWGNTEADAYSDGASLLASGNSSCEGGITNRSAYWAPAVFNQAGEALVPEALFLYYKSFLGGTNTDRSTIRPIPNGLQMLASRQVAGAIDRFFEVKVGEHLSWGNLQLKVSFPQCVAVDGAGAPVLASADNISHLSYANDYNSPSNCPDSHPYRIPQLTYSMNYDIAPGTTWMLSSDVGAGTAPGATLHADYIAAWDDAAMAAIVECNIVERRNCSPEGGRRQLPERFYSPGGTRIYDSSVRLEDDADRTPFGTEITPHAHGGHR